MKVRPAGWALAILLALTGWVAGQNPDYQAASPPSVQPAMGQQSSAAPYPDQPIVPQVPSLQRRAEEQSGPPPQQAGPGGLPQNAAPQNLARPNSGPPQPPFVLTPAEQARLDQLLLFWENSSQNVKKFRAKFRRFKYDPAWAAQNADPNKPTAEDDGELRYEAPDKGLFSIDQGVRPQNRPEKWICDGKSIYQYDFDEHKVREYPLPPEAQGKAIANGPVPFLFGAKAEQLKRRYWLRIITPSDINNEIWLEAMPKFLADAQDFQRVQIILGIFGKNDVMPTGVQIFDPGGKSRTAYKLYNITVNQQDPLGIFQDPFTARIPRGWQKIVEDDRQRGNVRQPRAGAGLLPAAMGNRGVAPR